MSLGVTGNSRFWDFDSGVLRSPSAETAEIAAPKTELVRSANDGVDLRVSTPGILVADVTLAGQSFTKLSLPDGGSAGEIGEPEQPLIRQFLVAPAGAAVTAEVTGAWQERSLAGAGISSPLVPVQSPIAKSAEAEAAAGLDLNAGAYRRDEYVSAEARIVEAGTYAGQRIISVEVTPVRYNPGRGTIAVAEELSVAVHFAGGAWSQSPLSPREDAELARLTLNHTATSEVKAGGRLLVIAHDSLAATASLATTFVAHKQSMGFTVDLVNTSTAGTTTTAIQAYIQGRYANLLTRPDAVLLVGDTDLIPQWIATWSMDEPDTDLYYACMDAPGTGDWQPELPIGRFSVTTATQLDAVINKTIAYDTAPAAAWQHQAVFMASTDYHTITEGTHDYVISTYMQPRGYTSDKLYSYYGASTSQVSTAFNSGRIFGVYSGHGAETYWADGPVFTQDDINALTNAGMYPLVTSFACLTGDYSFGECFAETWQRASGKGSVAIMASSVYSYWTEDDVLEKKLWSAMFDESILGFGSAINRAKQLYRQTMGNVDMTRRYFEMYNLFGDPTVELQGMNVDITTASPLPTGFVGEPYRQMIAASGGASPYTWSIVAGSLPAGLTLNSASGLVSGTPVSTTNAHFTVEVADRTHRTTTREFDLATVQRLDLLSNALPVAWVGMPYYQALQAAGGTLPYTWMVLGSGLPPGLTLNSTTGVLSGTPTQVDYYDLELRITDAAIGVARQSIDRTLQLEVAPLPPLAVSLPPTAIEGQGTIPAGITISTTSDVISDLTVALSWDSAGEIAASSSTATIRAGTRSVTLPLVIGDDALVDGTQIASIQASAAGFVSASATIPVDDNETAALAVSLPAYAMEGAGIVAGGGRIELDRVAQRDIPIRLTSSDTTELDVPATVIVPQGRNWATFDLTIVNDTLIDDGQIVRIAAHVNGWTDGSSPMEVRDNDRTLAVLLPARAWESQGTLPGAGTVTIGGTMTTDLLVTLATGDPSELTLPAQVLIPAGQTSVRWDPIVMDDLLPDGAQTVRVTAAGTGFPDAETTIRISDNEVQQYRFAPVSSPQRAGQPFTVTITAENLDGEAIAVFDDQAQLSASVGGMAVPLTLHGKERPKAPDVPLAPTETAAVPAAKAQLGSYQSYDEMTVALQTYAAMYPGICSLVSIGKSTQNRDLWAMKISDHPTAEEDEPEVAYLGALHGDERVGAELSLYFIDYLLGNYGLQPEVTQLVDQSEIWVLPMTNPDGWAASTRGNAAGVDLNRSFPDGAATPIGTVFDGPAMNLVGRPPEVAALMQWSAAHNLTLAANLHCGSLVVNYPYDNDGRGSVDSPTPDDALFEAIAQEYSSRNLAMWNSTTFPHGITNGADWYVVSGGLQDWQYRYLGTNHVTIEVSTANIPAPAELPVFWQQNRDAMFAYLETAQWGIRGVVSDSENGAPVYASVQIVGNTHPVFTDPDVGDYHRMLLPGTYTVVVSAPGYNTRTIPNVTVGTGTTRLDVDLLPLDAGIDFSGGTWTGMVSVDAVANGVVLWVADQQGRAAQSNSFNVVYGPVTHFAWSAVASPQVSGSPIAVSLTAQDAYNFPVTNYTGTVSIAAYGNDSSRDVGSGSIAWDFPLATASDDCRVQSIYLRSELGSATTLTGMALNLTALPGQALGACTIRLKTTTLASYSSAAWDSSGWTTVYQADSLIPATGWIPVAFNAPFAYDGVSNLMVDFSFNNSSHSSDGLALATDVGQTRTIYYETNSGYGNPLSWSGTANPTPRTSTNLPNVRWFTTTSLTVNPASVATFSQGVWTGSLVVSQAALGVRLRASAGSSVGWSNTFDIAAPGQPRVTAVTLSDAMLTDADQGSASFTVTVAFNEPMKTTVAPSITFAPAATTSLAWFSGIWVDNTHFRATYDVRDGNLEQTVDLAIDGAQDAGGTVQTRYVGTASLQIDTFNPSVSGVAVNPTWVSDATCAAGSVAIDVTFSEAMNGSIAPTITFPTSAAGSLLVSAPAASGWRDARTYRALYHLADTQQLLSRIDIRVSGARDAAGNLQFLADIADAFSVDTENPWIDLNGNAEGIDATAVFGPERVAVCLAAPDAALGELSGAAITELVVRIANLRDGASEWLDADLSGTTLSKRYDPVLGELTISGIDQAGFQQVLRRVQYTNIDLDWNRETRQVVFVAIDGVGNGSTPATCTVRLAEVNQAPAGADQLRTILEDSTYVFTPDDFGFSDAANSPPHELLAIKIVTLPALGYLKRDTTPIGLGMMITLEDLAAGRVTFRPGQDASGPAYVDFTFQVQDDGGTAMGGIDLDPTPRQWTFDVTPVNDAPEFLAGADHASIEDDVLQTVVGWATRISAGPHETQLLEFALDVDNPALFSRLPSIDPQTGTLTYQAAPNACGTATVTVYLEDDGGTANGGQDRSPARIFHIEIIAANDLPTLGTLADQTVEAGGPAILVPLEPADIETPADALQITATSSNADLCLLAITGSGAGRTLSITPSATMAGTTTITVTVADGAGGAAIRRFLLTVTAPPVGVDMPGVYAPDASTFFLHEAYNAGDADYTFVYGVSGEGWIPLVGDWDGDGVDTAGFYVPQTGTFYLRNHHDSGDADYSFDFGIGGQGWTPLVGDWDGDHRDSVAVYEPATSIFFFTNQLVGGPAEESVQFGMGSLGWQPLAGDWDGLPGDGIGFYEPATSLFFLKNARTSGPAEEAFQFGMGSLGWVALVGNWDREAGDGVGFYDPTSATFFLKNRHEPGPADVQFDYGIAGAGWRPLVGCWSAEAVASAAVPVAAAASAPSAMPAAADVLALAAHQQALADQEGWLELLAEDQITYRLRRPRL